MTQDERPPQLKSGNEASQELRGALRALGKQHTHPARLGRAAQELDRRLASLPASRSSISARQRWSLSHAQKKLLLTRSALGLLALGGAGLLWLGGWSSHQNEHLPPTRLATRHNVPCVKAPAETSRGALCAQPSSLPAQTSGSLDEAPAHAPARETVRKSVPKHTRIARRARVVAAPTGPSPASGPLPAAGVQQAVEASALVSHPLPAAPEVRPAAARELSEIELLFAARQKLKRDARAGLQLLDEHRARFPDGQLASEREVLAIEVLRQLGQADAAAKRFAAFRVRYADSLHLPRLQNPQ